MQYGVIEIDGQQYIERAQIFPQDVQVTSNFQVIPGRVTLPGVANFTLKGLTRDITAAVTVVRRFKFRLGNSDGQTWYVSGGIGSTTDRVVDTLIFGNGSFPYAIIPPIIYSAGANITWEIEDISGTVTADGPYTISLAFHGSYLIPVGTAPQGSVSSAAYAGYAG